jgi:hypothetical protein
MTKLPNKVQRSHAMNNNIASQTGSIIGLLILNTLIYSCATTQIPVSSSGVFRSNHGFSFKLPSGNAWEEKKQGNPLFSFYKLPRNESHSFYAQAAEFVLEQEFKSPEEFLVFVRNANGVDRSSDRFEIIESDFMLKPEIAPLCVYYRQKWKDYAAKNIGSNSFLITEATGYMVLHPDSSKLGLHISYSERYLKEYDSALQLEGDKYLKSLKVLPIE